ncbi:MAG: 30S ribosomal protein S16, partial [Flavobacteriaceae bacterium]|nr:30S ribosomal protein S16 [Flavobacteriaceae bacterium]
NGAQPTDTARAILSYKGVMLKKHLAGGVRKGAFTEEQAEEKFNAWIAEKGAAIDGKRTELSDAESKVKADALAAEKAINDKRVSDATEVAEEEAKAAAAEEAATEEAATEEAPAEVEASKEEE